jgi:hypothetical protein
LERAEFKSLSADAVSIKVASILVYLASLAQFGGRLATNNRQNREDVRMFCEHRKARILEKLREMEP